MRWGEKPPPPLAGAFRDEDATSLAVATRVPRDLQYPKAPQVAKRPAAQPVIAGKAFGRTIRAGKQRRNTQAVSVPVIEPPNSKIQLEPGDLQQQQLPSAFLVCAGVGVSSNNDEHPEQTDKYFGTSACFSNKGVTGASAQDHVKKLPSRPAPSSSSRQRSDSELELIINDLREKIALQHRIDEAKRKAVIDSTAASLDSSRSTGNNGTEQYPRKHLKNPLERVHSNPAMFVDSSCSNLLKRQQSVTCVNRPQSASHGERLTPREVVATGISAALSSASSSASLSRSHLHGAVGIASSNLHDEATLKRVYDDEGMLIKSYSGTGSFGYLPHFHSSSATGMQRSTENGNASRKKLAKRTSGAAASKSDKLRSFQLELRRENNASDSDSSSSFEDEHDNPFFARCALSPMGPWMSAASRPEIDGVEPHVSLSPLSTARTEDGFAELSPRTRLLWFSRCADEEPSPSASSMVLRVYQQSASHAGTVRPASARFSRQQRADGSKPTPVRCASANSTHPLKRQGGNNDVARSKTLVKRQPHSKGLKVRSEGA